MSNWKRLGSIAKGMLREAISDSDQENMTEEELLAKLDSIRENREEENSLQTKPTPREDQADATTERPAVKVKTTPPTRKPL